MAMNIEDLTGIIGGFRSYNSGTDTKDTKDTIKAAPKKETVAKKTVKSVNTANPGFDGPVNKKKVTVNAHPTQKPVVESVVESVKGTEPIDPFVASSSKKTTSTFRSPVSVDDLEKSKAKVQAVVDALKKSKTSTLKSKEAYKEATLGRKGEYDSVDNVIEAYNKAGDLGEVAVHETPEERYFATFVNNGSRKTYTGNAFSRYTGKEIGDKVSTRNYKIGDERKSVSYKVPEGAELFRKDSLTGDPVYMLRLSDGTEVPAEEATEQEHDEYKSRVREVDEIKNAFNFAAGMNKAVSRAAYAAAMNNFMSEANLSDEQVDTLLDKLDDSTLDKFRVATAMDQDPILMENLQKARQQEGKMAKAAVALYDKFYSAALDKLVQAAGRDTLKKAKKEDRELRRIHDKAYDKYLDSLGDPRERTVDVEYDSSVAPGYNYTFNVHGSINGSGTAGIFVGRVEDSLPGETMRDGEGGHVPIPEGSKILRLYRYTKDYGAGAKPVMGALLDLDHFGGDYDKARDAAVNAIKGGLEGHTGTLEESDKLENLKIRQAQKDYVREYIDKQAKDLYEEEFGKALESTGKTIEGEDVRTGLTDKQRANLIRRIARFGLSIDPNTDKVVDIDDPRAIKWEKLAQYESAKKQLIGKMTEDQILWELKHERGEISDEEYQTRYDPDGRYIYTEKSAGGKGKTYAKSAEALSKAKTNSKDSRFKKKTAVKERRGAQGSMESLGNLGALFSAARGGELTGLKEEKKR